MLKKEQGALLDIQERLVESGVILTLVGELDINEAPRVRKKLVDLTEKKLDPVVLSCAGVSRFDSSGLATFIEGVRLTQAYGGRLLLAEVPENMVAVIRISNLTSLFTMFDTEQQALEAPPK